jgi:hypothetical protein
MNDALMLGISREEFLKEVERLVKEEGSDDRN